MAALLEVEGPPPVEWLQRAWGRHAPSLSAAAAGGYAAGVLAVDPFRAHTVACPFLGLTGLWCPGCGSTRAVHELLHGDVAGSLACHPLVLPAIVLLAVGWAGWVARRRGVTATWASSPTDLPAWTVVAVGVLLVGLGVARNLPGLEWLAPPT